MTTPTGAAILDHEIKSHLEEQNRMWYSNDHTIPAFDYVHLCEKIKINPLALDTVVWSFLSLVAKPNSTLCTLKYLLVHLCFRCDPDLYVLVSAIHPTLLKAMLGHNEKEEIY